jgi:hypothetical protein
MPRVKLQSYIDSGLHCPEGKRKEELIDIDMPNLYLQVSSASPGRGTYFWRYKNADGKTCHVKLGRTTEIGLAEARNRARKVHARIELGSDPSGESKARKEIPTLTEFFEQTYWPFAERTFAKRPPSRATLSPAHQG